MKKDTRSLGGHFKDFKKEKQKLKGFCPLLRRRKHMKKATKRKGSHFKNFKNKKQKLKILGWLLRRRKQMMKATRNLGSHFKHFKKEKQILKGFSRLLRRRKRQEAFKVILKILSRKSKNWRFFVDYCKEGNMKQATKRMGSHFKNFRTNNKN
jgi:hypothetical protein